MPRPEQEELCELHTWKGRGRPEHRGQGGGPGGIPATPAAGVKARPAGRRMPYVAELSCLWSLHRWGHQTVCAPPKSPGFICRLLHPSLSSSFRSSTLTGEQPARGSRCSSQLCQLGCEGHRPPAPGHSGPKVWAVNTPWGTCTNSATHV